MRRLRQQLFRVHAVILMRNRIHQFSHTLVSGVLMTSTGAWPARRLTYDCRSTGLGMAASWNVSKALTRLIGAHDITKTAMTTRRARDTLISSLSRVRRVRSRCVFSSAELPWKHSLITYSPWTFAPPSTPQLWTVSMNVPVPFSRSQQLSSFVECVPAVSTAQT